MLISILLGIATSLATELVRWIDKKLVGTPAEGRGAFLLAFALAFLASALKVLVFDRMPGIALVLRSSWHTVTIIFTVSQVYFHLIAKPLGLRTETY